MGSSSWRPLRRFRAHCVDGIKLPLLLNFMQKRDVETVEVKTEETVVVTVRRAVI